ncbi:MAG: hypothetical protein K6G75_11540 [Lachnospiraceae bacterium]|nr:hypothetical protein [Lachnospiraceae bacterium]
MIYKCPNCGGVLEYNVESNNMICYHCDNSYSVNEVSNFSKMGVSVSQNPEIETETNAFNSPQSDEKIIKPGSSFSGFTGFAPKEFGDYNTLLERKEAEKQKEEARKNASIKMQIMRCTSCGAELAVNGVETSTFCAYCGQATVVQDRVEDYLKPDFIIPFKVTREDAERIIRTRLNSGFFVPKGIKQFEVEKIRGIYVPFWLFGMYYHDKQYYKYSKKQGKTTVTRYEYFEGETNFRRLTLDASQNLNDDSSSRLEPFDMRQLREFDTAYMSGYYSDRFDMGTEQMTGPAVSKAKDLFNSEAQRTIKHKTAKLVSSNPDFRVDQTEYALLPAWFLTFRYQNMPYTILVNGQTGKMVGAVPFVKGKVIALFSSLAIVLCAISVLLITALSHFFFLDVGLDEKITWVFAIGIPLGVFMLAYNAYRKYLSIVESLKLTTANQINKFAKERQDR